jgi:predicted transglutaminase-like cysteine proteinase
MAPSTPRVAVGVVALILSVLFGGSSANAQAQLVYAPVGDVTSVPAGYVQFCRDYPEDCREAAEDARDVVLSASAFRDMQLVNDRVNHAVEPVTDEDNYGVVEKWTFPDDGKGDCEDYVLLKRNLLIRSGWPRSALLITVVRDKKGDGHAVLTVKTDKGEFILDNQHPDILLWSDTNYRFVKRQSQHDQNVWISLGDPRPTISTATSR